MKDKKQKKNKGESVIGKIIYGFLLFLPLCAIGVTCLVNVFNNTEQQETTINYKYETNEPNNENEIIEGNYYKVDLIKGLQYVDEMDGLLQFSIQDYKLNKVNINWFYDFVDFYTDEVIYELPEYPHNKMFIDIHTNADDTTYLYLYFYNPTGDPYLASIINYEFAYNEDYSNQYYEFEGQVIGLYIPNGYNKSQNVFNKVDNLPIESVETHGINRNDTFYKSIEQVENSNLFNWSKNSIIYTGITATCSALSISNTFIPMLLTYWLIISVIYFLYDIILMCVLILHNKIHEMQDSI